VQYCILSKFFVLNKLMASIPAKTNDFSASNYVFYSTNIIDLYGFLTYIMYFFKMFFLSKSADFLIKTFDFFKKSRTKRI
jgi:hypothetical protein